MNRRKMYPKLSKHCYWELDIGDGSYDYLYYIQLRNRDYYITPDGVSVELNDGTSIHTNINPRGLFPESERYLDENEIFHILKLPVEGKRFSLDQMMGLLNTIIEEEYDDYD